MDYLKKAKWIPVFAIIVGNNGPVTVPMEPITKPAPTTIPRPSHDDPFNVPAPAVDPTPKGFSF